MVQRKGRWSQNFPLACTSEYAACLWEMAGKLDDHVSNPATIALGMLPSCAKQSQAVIDIQMRGESLGLKAEFIRQKKLADLQLATSAVLRRLAASKQ